MLELSSRAQLAADVAHAEQVRAVAQAERHDAEHERASIYERQLVGVLQLAFGERKLEAVEFRGVEGRPPQCSQQATEIAHRPAGRGLRHKLVELTVPQSDPPVRLDDRNRQRNLVEDRPQHAGVDA